MTRHRPRQIQDHHLDRLVVICHEEVHPQQDAAQPVSPAGPSRERKLVMRWGWPEEAIHVIEETHDLCTLVAHKQVGIIMMSITTSLPSSSSDLERLLDLCRETDTLIAIDGAVVELDRRTDFEEADRRRAEITTRAKWHYAAEGRAVSNPPTGYIKVAKGQWAKDVPEVQERIEEVFRLYNTLGSVEKVVRFLLEKRIEMPLRTPSGQLRWVRPTYSRIYSILTNPTYMGHYVYGRHTTVQGPLHRRQRRTFAEEQIVVPDHHEPYVSVEEWRRIDSRLKSHATRVRRQTSNSAAA